MTHRFASPASNNNNGNNILGFTSKLRQTLVVSRSKLDEWVEHQKAQADAVVSVQQAEIAEQQSRIDQAVTQLLSLQLENGCTVGGGEKANSEGNRNKQVLQEQKENLEAELEKLRKQLSKSESRTQDLRIELAHQKGRAMEALELKQNLEFTKEATIDDLTRGIINYKFLGLDFERADDNVLRFSFTQLDPNDPHRKFAFHIEVDSNEQYNITECAPKLDDRLVDELLRDLNETDDMIPMVRGMRRAFVEWLESQEST